MKPPVLAGLHSCAPETSVGKSVLDRMWIGLPNGKSMSAMPFHVRTNFDA
jgi:hypothetical protein